MKMRVSSRWTLVALVAGLFLSCGIEEKNHYENQKHYGRDAMGPGATVASGKSTDRVGPQVDIEEGDDVKDVDPNTVVYQATFVGAARPDSLTLLKETTDDDGKPMARRTPLGSMFGLAKILSKKRSYLSVAQTYGDQNNVSKFSQDLTAESDDEALKEWVDSDPDSREQNLQRTVTEGCPDTFVCVERQLIKSKVDGVTDKNFCYYDAQTGLPRGFPYGPSPKSTREEFAKYVTNLSLESNDNYEYPIYAVAKLPAEQTQCPDSLARFADETIAAYIQPFIAFGSGEKLVQYNLSAANKATFMLEMQLLVYTKEDGKFVRSDIDFRRTFQGRKRYFDDHTVLQGRTQYFINEPKGIIAAFTKEVRKPLIVPLKLFHGIIIELMFQACTEEYTCPEPGTSVEPPEARPSGLTQPAAGAVEEDQTAVIGNREIFDGKIFSFFQKTFE